ncbi:hypothetical protein GOP47_0005085 [Adiantum capillus-veneris]|uniref:Uncharacterized protein n=1 Tax=Adiantum capillus-veneris TaxID=13818 RepID=A0A9D4V4H0_ADICA|nr:hypothetical protein GOP47_0005085 [Adiantum capillus-veneris]
MIALCNMDQFLDRCHKGVTFVLRSSRAGLESGLDAHVIDDVLDLEASTKTINLFALWMESILPPDVLSAMWWLDNLRFPFVSECAIGDYTFSNFFGTPDLGSHIFTFFPILYGSHWVLVAFYNAHLIRIPILTRRLSAILLFDLLSIVCMERLLPHVSRVLKHFSKHCSNLQVKEELEDPHEACELITAQCPQQPNFIDCGYHVKTTMSPSRAEEAACEADLASNFGSRRPAWNRMLFGLTGVRWAGEQSLFLWRAPPGPVALSGF